MTYDINASLERLEQNLRDIDSARLQVEKTIMSSNQLQENITVLVNSMVELLKDISQWKKQLEWSQQKDQKTLDGSVDKIDKSCATIISNLGSSLDKATDDFKAKTSSSLSNLKEENRKLTEQVGKLDQLKTAITKSTGEVTNVKSVLGTLQSELGKSLKAQDAALQDILDKVKSVSPNVKKLIDTMAVKDEERNAKNLTEFDGLSKTLTQMQGEIDHVKKTANTLQLKISNNTAALDKLDKKLEFISQKVSSKVVTNRWLIIICFILLALMQIALAKYIR